MITRWDLKGVTERVVILQITGRTPFYMNLRLSTQVKIPDCTVNAQYVGTTFASRRGSNTFGWCSVCSLLSASHSPFVSYGCETLSLAVRDEQIESLWGQRAEKNVSYEEEIRNF